MDSAAECSDTENEAAGRSSRRLKNFHDSGSDDTDSLTVVNIRVIREIRGHLMSCFHWLP